ncbi:MAG: tetratricopeptide repeat protein [Okeania sp. SIO3B5]|uniref:tetratricopeptide repeat protein n=1 Tax=Okeania sp. SIO3B5 TaxID=2607811 RepID=UPI0013FF3BCA|nr:tetratricopeptide repeat protein [Okeania sp. SIO3B5]NEO57184.1 tetratricopeptide repeat protein [Okeania sp. SIO3B5]
MPHLIRKLFITILLLSLFCLSNPVTVIAATQPQNLTPTQLEELDNLFNQALNASNNGDFANAEQLWTQILEQYPDNPAIWSNRGNIRLSQNKIEEAISDYQKAIEIFPNAPDPYLNRGIAYERLNKWSEAIADYNQVIELDPEDPVAYNNRGNAEGGLGEWEKATEDYKKASELAPEYAFARANYSLALYQIGQTQEAVKTIKSLVRKYPNFADMRAALTACLWEQGKKGEAESNWVAAVGLDGRYQDLDWVANVRRWPPTLVNSLEKFIKIE